MLFPWISILILASGVFDLTLASPAKPSCPSVQVRKEWRQLSDDQKANWLSAVKCLSHKPRSRTFVPSHSPPDIVAYNTSGSLYDDFVFLHMEQNHWIHFTGFFLPWHRWFVYQFTKALQEQCGYEGVAPYWDWTLDSADVYGSSFFKESSPISGLGGWGDPKNDYTVSDGALSSGFALSYPVYHHVRRNWTIQPYIALAKAVSPVTFPNPYVLANSTFTPEKVRNLTNSHVGDYVGFQTDIEQPEHMHAAVHVMMGGDLSATCPASAPPTCVGGPTFSPNDPLFMLHHAMIDKVWSDWQAKDNRNAVAFAGGSTQEPTFVRYPTGTAPWLNLSSPIPTDGLFPSTIVGDILSIQQLCYCYE